MQNQGPFEMPVDSAEIARFVGVATFMRSPLIDDFSRVDIGLVGIPFDLGLAYRPGARHAPAAVREASRVIRRGNCSTGVFPFELCQVADVGDVVCHPYNYDEAIKAMEVFIRDLREHGANPVACGGDHVITLPILRGLADLAPLAVVQFDSHSDTFDEFYGCRVNHATTMRRAAEEGLINPARCIQVGLRGSMWDRDDLQGARDLGIHVVTYDDYEAMGRAAAIAEIKRVVGDGPVYVTYDVDALDPSQAPGTAVLEPGGFTMRDSQVIIRSLTGLKVVGGDVSEVSPLLDPTGITAHNAANLMFEILCLVARSKAAEVGAPDAELA